MSENSNERHSGDELASAGKSMNKAAHSGIDAGKDIGGAISDARKNRQDKAGASQGNKASDKNNQNGSDSALANGARNSQNNAMGAQGAQGGNRPSPKGIGGANKASKTAGKNADKAKDTVSKVASSISGRRKSLLRRIIKAIRRVLRALRIFVTILPALVIIFLCMFPTLFLRALIHEVLTKAANGLMEFTYTFFGMDDNDGMTDEERKEMYKRAAEEFVSDVEDGGIWVLDQLSQGAHTFFQFCDDITDDDTWLGGFCNDMANYFYKNHVSLQVYKAQKNDHLDSNSLMQVMVIDELRSGYADTSGIDLNHMLNFEWQKACELRNYYCQEDETYDKDTSCIGAMEMFFFLEPPFHKNSLSDEFRAGDKISGFSDLGNQTYIPTHNIPIVISDPDYYVYLQGSSEPEGYIDEKGQHLRDCIMYNPYGNTRSSLNVQTGSDYEMMAMAAYLISVYSACTPYDKQSIADMVTKIHEGMHDTDTSLVSYTVNFTSPYLGAIVPRLYQPYLYTGGQYGVEVGTPIEGYFEKGGDREIVGMTPLKDRNEIYTVGWVDLNGDMIYQKNTETFPICLQVMDPDNSSKPFYSDSFTVISYDKTRNNMKYEPEKSAETAEVNAAEDTLGYHVTGIDEAHKELFADKSNKNTYRGYVDFDWETDFRIQAQRQENICNSLSEELRSKYIYRYEFPFARISCGGLDSGGGKDGYERAVKISTFDDTGDSYSSSMIYVLNGEYYYLNNNTADVMAINGNAAWAYVGKSSFDIKMEDHKDYDGASQTIKDKDLIFNDISVENWGEDTVFKENENTLITEFGVNPCVYNAKIRYMISVDVVAIPRYSEFIAKSFGYEPSEMLKRDVSIDGALNPTGGRDITQSQVAEASLKAYMTMLGIKEEVVAANNPQIGTERTYSYEEMLEILRSLQNANYSQPDANRKYMVYLALCMCGRVMYEFSGYADSMNYEHWKTLRQGSDPTRYLPDGDGYVDSKYGNSEAWRNDYGYEYNGLDCSGFVSLIIRLAFDKNFSRFDSSSVIDIAVFDPNANKTTKSVIEKKAKATSRYGEVFLDDSKLMVGDFGVKRKYDEKTGTYSGHVAMYIGRNSDGSQNWVEMTRFGMDKPNPTVGVRIFTTTSYKEKSNAVYVRPNMIPTEPVTWTVMNPAWMLIPTQSEIMYYVEKEENQDDQDEYHDEYAEEG